MSSNTEVSYHDAAVHGPAAPTGDTAAVTLLVVADLAGHEPVADDTERGRDAAGAVIHRIDAAVDALGSVDFATWSDSSLSGHLDELSLVLCRVDAELSRLADAVRSRGFDIAEVDLPLAS